MSGVNRYEEITHRDPVPKTIVREFVADYPHESDQELSDRIRRAASRMGGNVDDKMTPEVVAYWRAQLAEEAS